MADRFSRPRHSRRYVVLACAAVILLSAAGIVLCRHSAAEPAHAAQPPAIPVTIDVATARDEAIAKGVIINGLVILSETPLPWNPEHTNPPGGLEQYYRDNVAGGPGSFVIAADGFESFGRAIIKKMIAEIAMLHVAPRIIMR